MMNNDGLVSFIVPTLNQAGFLRRCIDGCLSQKILRREVLAQDGGSTDSTIDILKSYGDQVKWVSEPDAGQSDAINKAIARANGSFIAWINSDDYYYDESALARVCEQFESDPAIDVVYGDGLYVDTDGNPLRAFRSFPLQSPRRSLIFRPTSPFAQPAVFFKKELFVDAGGLRNDLHWAMDHELWIRLFEGARRWVYVPEFLSCQTIHPEAKSLYGMKNQIKEVRRCQLDYLNVHGGRWFEKVFVRSSFLESALYQLAVRSGAIKLWWKIIQ